MQLCTCRKPRQHTRLIRLFNWICGSLNYKLSHYFPVFFYKWNQDINGRFLYLDVFSRNHSLQDGFIFQWKRDLFFIGVPSRVSTSAEGGGDWGILPLPKKFAYPCISPTVLPPKCWFCNFYAVFGHFAQNQTSHKSTLNGKPCPPLGKTL